MHDHLALIRKLWRGESVLQKDVEGNEVSISVLPKPIQRELPVFLTSSGNPETWKKAGELGINVLCSLSNHTIEDLNVNIAAYREERRKHGFDPHAGIVSTMVHTYVGVDNDSVKKKVKEPLRDFLNGFINQNDTLNPYKDQNDVVRSAIDNDREALISYAFEKHFNQTSLMGSRQKCIKMVQKLHDVGVNEVACLIDFGLTKHEVLEGLKPLAELKDLFKKSVRSDLPELEAQEA
jgi:natural product biosynthesis luciferase-like monooxygenase protein